jgi:hypothetical protein
MLQYLGDLRDFVARAVGVHAGEIRIMSMGAENLDDALQLTALHRGYDMPLLFNTLKVRANPFHVSSFPPNVLEVLHETAPNVLLGGNAPLMRMLLYLLDLPAGTTDVHREAYSVLARLPTFREVTADLKAAAAPCAGAGLPPVVRRVLCIPEEGAGVVQKRPGALLYTLEALYALMRPATSGPQSASPACVA